MAEYNVQMRYIEGKMNVIADALSRVCCMEPPEEDQGVTLLEVNAITNTLPASPAKLDEIWNQTSQDNPAIWKMPFPKGGLSIQMNAFQT